MKKKDYELIAGALWRSERALGLKDHNQVKRVARAEMHNLIVTDLVATLGHADPKFDKQRFYQQCGVGLERLGFDLPQDTEE